MTLAGSIFVWTMTTVVAISVMSQLGLYISAGIELRRLRRRDRFQLWRRVMASPMAPRVTVLVPAYNEGVSIVESVRSLLALTYPNLEVVVVSDGSTDDTVERLVQGFELSPVLPVYQRVIETEPIRQMYRSAADARLVVVDKHNGGKADALNAAVNIASGQLVCAVDADTLVAPDALQQLVAPFLAEDDVVAAGGTIKLLNDTEDDGTTVRRQEAPRNPLVGAQAVEYIRAFLIGRLAWNPLGGNLIISGAFGLFRRSSLVDVGGYLHGSIGEDMELIVRLRRHGYETGRRAIVEFVPDPVAYTEAPESWRFLARQRNRWYRGLLDVLVRHRKMLGNPRYGTAGMLAMPYFAIVEAGAPILELVGLCMIALGLVTGWITVGSLAPIALAYSIGLCATLLVLILEDSAFHTYKRVRDRFAMLAHVLFELVVFRTAASIWRLWGLKLFLQGRSEWGAQRRKGLA